MSPANFIRAIKLDADRDKMQIEGILFQTLDLRRGAFISRRVTKLNSLIHGQTAGNLLNNVLISTQLKIFHLLSLRSCFGGWVSGRGLTD